jgi:hypothetical protein
MELRHQRNPDVVDGFVLHNKGNIKHTSSKSFCQIFSEIKCLVLKDDVEGNRENKPTEYIYHMIETLLPEANYNKKTKKGHFLELYEPYKGTNEIFLKSEEMIHLLHFTDGQKEIQEEKAGHTFLLSPQIEKVSFLMKIVFLKLLNG